jgi:hypothetical protein
MNQNFTFLIHCDISCRAFSFCVGAVMRGVATISSAANSPLVIAGYNVLIFSGHGGSS